MQCTKQLPMGIYPVRVRAEHNSLSNNVSVDSLVSRIMGKYVVTISLDMQADDICTSSDVPIFHTRQQRMVFAQGFRHLAWIGFVKICT